MAGFGAGLSGVLDFESDPCSFVFWQSTIGPTVGPMEQEC